MSITDGENRDLVSVSVNGSHKEQGQQKYFRPLLPQNNPTVDLTATSNYKKIQWIKMTTKKNIYQHGTSLPLTMKKIIKLKINLIHLNHHLIHKHKLRQIYHQLFLQYLQLQKITIYYKC